MRRRTLLGSVGAGAAGALAGCSFGSNSGRPPSASAGLVVRVTGVGDALADFSTLRVHVARVGLDPASGSAGKVPSETTADLTGAPATVLTTRFPAEDYERASLHGGVASATTTDGSSPDVRMPHAGLEYEHAYTLQPGQTVTLTLPIRVSRTGSGTYALSADGSGVTVSTSDGVPTTRS